MGVLELAFLDGQQEHRPWPQVEGNADLVLELAVDVERLREQLVDPGGGLAKEKAAVSPRGAGADAARVDEDDAGAGFREESRAGAPGEARADDDDVGTAQLLGDSPPRRLRQNIRAPTAAPTPASVAPMTPARLLLATWRAFCLAIGLAAASTSQPMKALRLLNILPPI
jgi:hypothetical protein